MRVFLSAVAWLAMKFPYDLHFKCSLSFGLSLAPVCAQCSCNVGRATWLQQYVLSKICCTPCSTFASSALSLSPCVHLNVAFSLSVCLLAVTGHNGNVLTVVVAAFIVIYCQKCQLHNREHIRAASANMNSSIGHFFVWCKLEWNKFEWVSITLING